VSETPRLPRVLPPELDPRGRAHGRALVARGTAASGRPPATPAPSTAPGSTAAPSTAPGSTAARSTAPGSTAALAMPVGRAGGRRFARALSWVAALTAMVVLFGSGGAYLYVNQKFGSIDRISGLCLRNCKDRPSSVGRTENYLLVGSDSRAGLNGTGANAGLQDPNGGGQRSDTTMLVHLSADREKVFVISFPRDLYVDVPRYTDPKSGRTIGGFPQKFNYAYGAGYDMGKGIGGDAYGDQLAATMVTKQVESLTGLPVDHYVEIDFNGFQQMVDSLGGIQVCLDRDAYDPGGEGSGGSGFAETKGVHTLNGQRALQYVRQRHGLPGGDFGRIGRQQRFLASLTRQIKSAGTLLNPIKLDSFVSAVVRNVKIDTDTGQKDLLGLATKLRNLNPERVQFLTVPIGGEDTRQDDGIGYRAYIDKPKAHLLFQSIHDDLDPNAPPKPSPAPSAAPRPSGPPLTVPPSQVGLTVQNGSGTPGQATKAAADLRAVGFLASAIDGGDPVRRTEIRYGSGRTESAQTLAAALPFAVLVPTDAGGTQSLLLVAGGDYTAAQAVTLGGAAPATTRAAPPTRAAPTPSASATPALPAVNAQDADCGP